jgi:hypothetical protein
MAGVLAIPLERLSDGTFFESPAADSAGEELFLTDSMKNLLQRNYSPTTAIVEVGSGRYQAEVFVPKSDQGGVAFVLTDPNLRPLSATTADQPLERQSHSDYAASLAERISLSEGPSPHTTVSLWSNFVPPNLQLVTSAAEDVELPWESLRHFSRLMILGPPGSGKTSCLRRLALELLDAPDRPLPVYLQLRELSLEHMDERQLAAAVVRHSPTLDFAAAAQRGSLMLLLDGLDEVPISARPKLLQLIESTGHQYPNIKIILTSRWTEARATLRDYAYVSILPFTDSQVAQWAWQSIPDGQTCERFLELAWSHSATRELVRQPLLLGVAVDTFKRHGTLPPRVSDLYEVFIRMLCDDWDRTRGVSRHPESASTEDVIRLLSQLSHQLLVNGRVTFSDAELPTSGARSHLAGLTFASISERCGLIRHTHPDTWQFAHRSFLEYFASQYLVRRLDDVMSELIPQLADPTWQRVWTWLCQLTPEDKPLTAAARVSQLHPLVVSRLLTEAITASPQLPQQELQDASDYIVQSLEATIAQLTATVDTPTSGQGRQPTWILVHHSEDCYSWELEAISELVKSMHRVRDSRAASVLQDVLRHSSSTLSPLSSLLDGHGVLVPDLSCSEEEIKLTVALQHPIGMLSTSRAETSVAGTLAPEASYPLSHPVKVQCIHWRKDAASVHAFAAKLQRDGIDVWLGNQEVTLGDDILRRVEEALEECDVVLMFLPSQREPRRASISSDLSKLTSERLKIHLGKVILVLTDPHASVPDSLRLLNKHPFEDYKAIRRAIRETVEAPPLGGA